MKILKFTVVLSIVGGLLISCTATPDFQDNHQVAKFLTQKKLDLDGMGNNPNGGKIRFNADGTFTMVSANTDDPTQNYKGTWILGGCRDCNTDYFQKDIQFDFKNHGWVTDGYNENGTPVTGYGTQLSGYITKEGDKWSIIFAINDPVASFNGDVKKDFQRDLIAI